MTPSAGRGVRHARVRCAIYTRKSSEEGLGQEFNSLQAQREACEAFMRSSSARSWASASATRSPLEEEGDVDGRRAAARVSGAGPQARHHRCLRFLAGVAAVSRPRSSATATSPDHREIRFYKIR